MSDPVGKVKSVVFTDKARSLFHEMLCRPEPRFPHLMRIRLISVRRRMRGTRVPLRSKSRKVGVTQR